MDAHHGHGGAEMVAAWLVHDALVGLVLLGVAAGYGAALWAARRRGPWPALRTVCWYLGVVSAGAGLLGPVAVAARESFTAHMAAHLLVGMAAPLLLVLGAPVTLTMRALPAYRARRLSRLLQTGFVRVVTHPLVAGVLNAGGLWALYTTELYRLMHTSVLLHGLVHLHVFLAGYLLTASLVGVDPNPHRCAFRVRAAVLVVFVAAHSVLSKWVYANPPAGVDAADARTGAQLMYYGGDAVDVALIVLLFLGWYTATRPRGSETSVVTPRGAASDAAPSG